MGDPVVREHEEADRDACRGLWAQLTQWHRDLYKDQTIGLLVLTNDGVAHGATLDSAS